MSPRQFATLLIAVACLHLAGCATRTAVLEGYQPVVRSAQLQVVDARPESQKTGEFISLLITNCNYAILRVGDDQMVPSRLVLLRDDLIRDLSSQLDGKEVLVEHYTIHVNRGVVSRNAVYGLGYSGIVAGVMRPMGSNCAKEETAEGWYAASEVTAYRSPLIVDIAVRLDGQRHAVRVVHTPAYEVTGAFHVPAAARELFAAVSLAHVRLIENVKRASVAASP